jgi:carboxypeptidase family protein
MYVKQSLRLFIFCFAVVIPSIAQQIVAPNPQSENITSTVTDANNDDSVSGANVILNGPTPSDQRTVISDDNGFFEFRDLKPGASYRATINGNGLVGWTSPFIVLNPGQYFLLTGIKLKLSAGVTSVTVYASTEQIAVRQVKLEEQQRVFGIIPNF